MGKIDKHRPFSELTAKSRGRKRISNLHQKEEIHDEGVFGLPGIGEVGNAISRERISGCVAASFQTLG
jgi:hypothetical protein